MNAAETLAAVIAELNTLRTITVTSLASLESPSNSSSDAEWLRDALAQREIAALTTELRHIDSLLRIAVAR